MSEDNQLSLEENLIFERYKHLIARQTHLDSLVSSNVATAIKVTTALCTLFFVAISFLFKEMDKPDVRHLTLLIQFCSVTGGIFYLLISLQTLANIFAWFGYRKDEVELLELANTILKRDKPTPRNFLTWQETWFLFVTLILTFISWVVWFRAVELAAELTGI
ncbi:TPA: hypothetical protein ACX6R8_001292 [Photobacterium damselae]|uniref:hypothetical protein n=1 Tax=Photobacterium damselae TaxID=38293 RepID=UPI00109BB90C|nr:hypothetical protein [Photobacterium damselae]TGZ33948.1 hypothetical protein EQ875_02787 [Photobacterium damselae subsp. damselae]